jgi:hypothetical protein
MYDAPLVCGDGQDTTQVRHARYSAKNYLAGIGYAEKDQTLPLSNYRRAAWERTREKCAAMQAH